VWHPLHDDPNSLNAFHDYCDVDVLSEEEAHTRLVPLSDEEMEDLLVVNERIDDRGLRIDTISAYAAITVAEKTQDKMDEEELFDLTDGAVPAFTLTARIKEWISQTRRAGHGAGQGSRRRAVASRSATQSPPCA
jgi:DNA polymerase